MIVWALFSYVARGCKGLLGWYKALFSTFARLTEGRGAKLFGQCPYRTNTFQKGASLTLCIEFHACSALYS